MTKAAANLIKSKKKILNNDILNLTIKFRAD